jgi:hypothetical protein
MDVQNLEFSDTGLRLIASEPWQSREVVTCSEFQELFSLQYLPPYFSSDWPIYKFETSYAEDVN